MAGARELICQSITATRSPSAAVSSKSRLSTRKSPWQMVDGASPIIECITSSNRTCARSPSSIAPGRKGVADPLDERGPRVAVLLTGREVDRIGRVEASSSSPSSAGDAHHAPCSAASAASASAARSAPMPSTWLIIVRAPRSSSSSPKVRVSGSMWFQ